LSFFDDVLCVFILAPSADRRARLIAGTVFRRAPVIRPIATIVPAVVTPSARISRAGYGDDRGMLVEDHLHLGRRISVIAGAAPH